MPDYTKISQENAQRDVDEILTDDFRSRLKKLVKTLYDEKVTKDEFDKRMKDFFRDENMRVGGYDKVVDTKQN